MLIAEELLLLALDDRTGRPLIGAERLDPAMGGALLAELALSERIGIAGRDAGWTRRGRIRVISDVPTDDPVLDDLMATLAGRPELKAKDLISGMSRRRITKGLRPRLLERLATAGAVRPKHSKVLGLIPRTTWPAADAAAEDEVRRRLQAALVVGLTPAERTVALIALLRVLGLVTKVIETEDKRASRRRAKELSEGDWAAQAVKDAIQEVTAAAAAAAATTAAG